MINKFLNVVSFQDTLTQSLPSINGSISEVEDDAFGLLVQSGFNQAHSEV